MTQIAIIPARGGSKRIPRKNIKAFHGKPIIAYSIEAALQSDCFDRVIVSTDDNEIASVAKKYGADVPFMRPAQLADDYATTLEVIQHALKTLGQKGDTYQYVCCIYATAPFVTSTLLRQGLELLQKSQNDYLFPICAYPAAIQRALKKTPDGKLQMFDPDQLNTRSQDLTPAYFDPGQFYWGRSEAFQAGVPIFSEKACGIEIDKKTAVDIDDESDWRFAEALYRYHREA